MHAASDSIFDIHTLLTETQPDSILLIGSDGDAAVSDYRKQRAFLKRPCRIHIIKDLDVLAPLQSLGRFDIGIVINVIEHLDKEIAERLIAGLRDIHTARFCVVVPIGDAWEGHRSTWEAKELRSLGLTLVNAYEYGEGILHLYKFDVASYKTTPKWLSPDKWANPQLWNKYRW